MNHDLAKSSFEADNDNHSFTLILRCTELPSVNSAHGINTKTKVVFDMPWLTQFKQELSDQLIFADPKGNCPWITPGKVYFLAIKYILKQYPWSRDLDNLHKYTQDRIAEAIHINDSHIIEIHMWKNYRPDDYEYMIIKFGESLYDYNQFN
jgi:Holliday junction resolvase RusA-like endonuclease